MADAVPATYPLSPDEIPSPAETKAKFAELMKENPEDAVHYLYKMGCDCGYIKFIENARNLLWEAQGPFGPLELSVNLAKPEKDPKEIAKLLEKKAEGPKELAPGEPPTPPDDLCFVWETFPGNSERGPKPGLRIAEITLGGEDWGFQYSPYAYFSEHCIAMSKEHRPMHIDPQAFTCLLDFVDLFPFYFIGSNADLPIVGGSILNHDHFQGGRHVFPVMKCPVVRTFSLPNFPDVKAGVVEWPASVIRLASPSRDSLLSAATLVFDTWKNFDDEGCGIYHETNGARHNTLNPIVHKEGDNYVMDMVLRNNRTDEAHPYGIFHPEESLHHIKKENIGLIEIMGLAIFPGRLIRELPAVQTVLYESAARNLTLEETMKSLEADELTFKHTTWALDVLDRRRGDLEKEAAGDVVLEGNNPLGTVMREEVGFVFSQILEATGVFKHDDTGTVGWDHLLEALGAQDV